MDASCEFATQSTYCSPADLTRQKMLSVAQLMSFLPQVSCSTPAPEDQPLKDSLKFASLTKFISESDYFASVSYKLGVFHANLVTEMKELGKRVEEMNRKSEETNRKFIYTYLAIGALAASCFGKRAWAKVKDLSASFKGPSP